MLIILFCSCCYGPCTTHLLLPPLGEKHCVTTLITAVKETFKMLIVCKIIDLTICTNFLITCILDTLHAGVSIKAGYRRTYRTSYRRLFGFQ